MGTADDVMAVVDSHLRVRGIRGLRVVDAVLKPARVTCKLAALKQSRALIRPLLRFYAPQPSQDGFWGRDSAPALSLRAPTRNPCRTKRVWIPDRVRDDEERESPNPNPSPHPVEAGPSSTDGGGPPGQTCLSRRRVVWTAAEVEQRRLPEAKRRDPDVGSPFLWLRSFGEAKERDSPAGATPGLVVKGKPPKPAMRFSDKSSATSASTSSFPQHSGDSSHRLQDC